MHTPTPNTEKLMDASHKDPAIIKADDIEPPVLPSDGVPAAPPGTWALKIIAVVVLLYVMHWAADVLIPLLFGILVSYTFSPVVSTLEKLHIHRAIGAGIVTLALMGSVVAVSNTLYREASVMLDELPL